MTMYRRERFDVYWISMEPKSKETVSINVCTSHQEQKNMVIVQFPKNTKLGE